MRLRRTAALLLLLTAVGCGSATSPGADAAPPATGAPASPSAGAAAGASAGAAASDRPSDATSMICNPYFRQELAGALGTDIDRPLAPAGRSASTAASTTTPPAASRSRSRNSPTPPPRSPSTTGCAAAPGPSPTSTASARPPTSAPTAPPWSARTASCSPSTSPSCPRPSARPAQPGRRRRDDRHHRHDLLEGAQFVTGRGRPLPTGRDRGPPPAAGRSARRSTRRAGAPITLRKVLGERSPSVL